MNPAIIRVLWEALKVQKSFHAKNLPQALKGPEPTKNGNSAGDSENQAIKQASRGSWGNTILQQMTNVIQVNSIESNGGGENDLGALWIDQNMAQKWPQVVRDAMIGGVGYLLAEYDEDEEKDTLSVVSPQEIVAVYSDPVNDARPKYGMRKYKRLDDNGKTIWYLKVWDDTNFYIYEMTKPNIPIKGDLPLKGVGPAEGRPHGYNHLPIGVYHDMLTSDGEVHSTFEMIAPQLDTLRQHTYNLNSLTYWNANRILFFVGVDMDDPKTAEAVRKMQYSLRTGDQDILIAPPGTSIDKETLKIVQTQPGDLPQVLSVVQDARNTLASLVSLPASVFEPAETAQSAEGSQQEWAAFYRQARSYQDRFTPGIIRLLDTIDSRQSIVRETPTKVVWRPPFADSVDTLGDQVVKFTSAGFSLKWVVDTILPRYFTPAELADLKEQIASGATTPGDVNLVLPNTTEG